jgi:hypothetical protein
MTCTTSSSRWRSPTRAVTLSPTRTVVDALAGPPFTLTWPARHNAVAADLVWVARTAHNHLSTLAASIHKASHEPARAPAMPRFKSPTLATASALHIKAQGGAQ